MNSYINFLFRYIEGFIGNRDKSKAIINQNQIIFCIKNLFQSVNNNKKTIYQIFFWNSFRYFNRERNIETIIKIFEYAMKHCRSITIRNNVSKWLKHYKSSTKTLLIIPNSLFHL